MKKTSVLTAVSMAAMLGISGAALAQGTGMSPGSGSAPSGNTMQRQQDSGGSPPAQQHERSGSSTSGDRMGPSDRTSPSQAQGAPSKEQQKSNQAQERSPSDAKQPAQAQDQRAPAGNSKMGGDMKGDKSGATVGSAASGSVNLTTEQRTEIRQTVLTPSAPRATNVNFAVNVGTVVPSSVHVVEVPTTLVRIHPQWRGFRYFVVNDEIVIVEPRTLKIVAVLNV